MRNGAGISDYLLAVEQLYPAPNTESAQTITYTAIQQAHEHLSTLGDRSNPDVIVVFTDGFASDLETSNEFLLAAETSSVSGLRIDVIGYGVKYVLVCDEDALAQRVDLDRVREFQGFGDNRVWQWDAEILLREYGMTPEELNEQYCESIIDPMIEMTRITGGEYQEVSRAE